MSEEAFSAVDVPSADYLAKLGEVVYRVSDLEWAALDDPHANHRLIDFSELYKRSTGQIAEALARVASEIDQGEPQGHFLHVASRALQDIAPMRNRILHARPEVMPDGSVCLLHLRSDASGVTEFAWIDEPYLDHVLGRIDYWARRLARSSARAPGR